jgi:hypothetical protein
MDASAELILTATTLLFTSCHVLETGKLGFFIYCHWVVSEFHQCQYTHSSYGTLTGAV